MSENKYTHGLGRRKTSVARVRLRPGTGTVVVNGRDVKEYFPNPQWAAASLQPLDVVEKRGHFDVIVKISGGGLTGQSGAMALGIARALTSLDKEAYYANLRAAGQMTRDAREVERKKYGLAGARRAFQFSKR